MITGYLLNIRKELTLYPAGLQAGFRFLLETNLSKLTLGRHEILGDRMYALVSEYETEPKSKRRPEAHQRYLDIQCICSGEEMIGSGPLEAAGEIVEKYIKQRDIVYYKNMAAETEINFNPGMFAVYFPWDVHRPNCCIDGKSGKVRKVVVKIVMTSIDLDNK
ncbi:Hypothetical protein LUCI_2944 [Lucifera butyrica]|uniref:YhcH/YjgK/YiaL family protein n=1 Tax=Lucifera butyrica TaxID=1351585 RepID=A0A498R922_9FIRM|nr:YhcH/YjgK/YiaL family protein [Lucifera butyrica]VBB07679.1 Hypothetical protein LUCI_2944 [Lucifera butyrica]